ncbi:hypothetical protein [Bacillus halotolerans]|uniref:hypothetical protein n=1 Tax=Bacillus halotolerans TaxID=260554 RepID=UPI001879F4C4|nr:hypothetical protein [Bacillus halotolerans]MEC1543696.1 hypothetical protein [Bacillus halotolerans]
MNIEKIAEYGNSVGGLIVLLCVAIIWVVSKQMGKDERSNAIFLRVYCFMFYVLAGLILLSIFLELDEGISGQVYKQLTVLMFALSTLFGTIYLFILKKKF